MGINESIHATRNAIFSWHTFEVAGPLHASLSTSHATTHQVDMPAQNVQTLSVTPRDVNPTLGPYLEDPAKKSVVVKVSDSCPCHHPNSRACR